MNGARWLACGVLIPGLLACNGESPGPQDTARPALSAKAQPSGQGKQPAGPADPAPPPPLDLTVPPLEPGQAEAELPGASATTRLPDLFQQGPAPGRTSLSGGLIINENGGKPLDMERVEGARIDVEVSLD